MLVFDQSIYHLLLFQLKFEPTLHTLSRFHSPLSFQLLDPVPCITETQIGRRGGERGTYQFDLKGKFRSEQISSKLAKCILTVNISLYFGRENFVSERGKRV